MSKVFNVNIEETIENEDGSVLMKFQTDPKTTSLLASIGMKFLMHCAAARLDSEMVFEMIADLIEEEYTSETEEVQEELPFTNE